MMKKEMEIPTRGLTLQFEEELVSSPGLFGRQSGSGLKQRGAGKEGSIMTFPGRTPQVLPVVGVLPGFAG